MCGKLSELQCCLFVLSERSSHINGRRGFFRGGCHIAASSLSFSPRDGLFGSNAVNFNMLFFTPSILPFSFLSFFFSFIHALKKIKGSAKNRGLKGGMIEVEAEN